MTNMKFRIESADRDFIFKTSTSTECSEWISAIRNMKERMESDAKVKSGVKIIVEPKVGFVLKSKQISNDEKIFVNVFWSDEVETFMSSPSESNKSIFSIVIPSSLFRACQNSSASKDLVFK